MKQNNTTATKKVVYTALSQEGYSLPQPVESEKHGSGYVSYGERNEYAQWLWELYEDTAIFQTLVNNLLDYLCGDETIYTKDDALAFEMTANEIEDVLRKCFLDYIIYNACSVQRIRNGARQLVKLAYLDQAKVRYNRDLTKIYYNNDWSKRDSEIVELPLDRPELKSDAVTLRSVCKSVYPIPLYNGALKSIVIANKIDTYHLNNISNSFSSNTLLNFNNGVPDEKTKDKIETMLRDKFAGEENAGKFICSWNESKDNEATIVSLDSNDFDAKYNALRQNYEQNIVVAFRCPAQLLGYGTQKTTFNTIEYVAAFDLYNRTMVKPMQRRLLKFFNDALEGAASLNIAPYVIKFDTSDYDSNKPLQ